MATVPPDYVIDSPSDKGLSLAAWNTTLRDGKIAPLATITKTYRNKSYLTARKNKSWFSTELIAIIELCIISLQKISPETYISTHLLNYLAELEQKRLAERALKEQID